VRLDHLLSKEHVHRVLYTGDNGAKSFRRHMFSGGAHGWNIDIVARQGSCLSVRHLRVTGTESWCEPGLLHAVGS
jgi:hypothetical protein